MPRVAEKILRCAIYTRKSTEHGLELEFNSLDAQREACAAFIKSQASEGWHALPTRYDDPAYSGGDMNRPALQKLLQDTEAGQIDVVVVYKIDRLTRSLADFAKLVELFDAKSVSFVAVTQQFNTTTSMGRLTLNVLLSFAQFERELASERVRDKVAASRKKGKWTGGGVPLGYEAKDKRLVVNPVEAQVVRTIFARYLALKSLQTLINELNDKGIVTKRRPVGNGITGGIPFTYGPLAYLLKNRTYLGEMGHHGHWFPGEHEPIIARGIFEEVQHLLRTNSAGRRGRHQTSDALLTGLLFDDRGNRMSPSYAAKNGVRYPFYVSSAILRGRKSHAGSIGRVSATEIEGTIVRAIRDLVEVADQPTGLTQRQLVEQFVERVVITTKGMTISLRSRSTPIEVAWDPPKKHELAQIEIGPESRDRCSPNPQLVQAIVHAHVWLKSLLDGSFSSIGDLAQAAKLHPKVIRARMRLAFLAPELMSQVLQGSQRASINVKELCGAASLNWREQLERVGELSSRDYAMMSAFGGKADMPLCTAHVRF
jgi:DNA invertase Pin-like site-specific DNA recombinase